jgi:transitional endoplasmic reticulum ATPase
MKNKENKIKLKVTEALQDDAYKGIARMDQEVMKQLGIKRGDPISIQGDKITTAIADYSYPADVGEGIIRIDGLLRKNAGVSIGEEVSISKTEIKEAKKITIAPAQQGIMVQADPESLRRGLLGRTLSKGDLFTLGGVQRRKDIMEGLGGGDLDDIFGDLLGNMGFGNLGGGMRKYRR